MLFFVIVCVIILCALAFSKYQDSKRIDRNAHIAEIEDLIDDLHRAADINDTD